MRLRRFTRTIQIYCDWLLSYTINIGRFFKRLWPDSRITWYIYQIWLGWDYWFIYDLSIILKVFRYDSIFIEAHDGRRVYIDMIVMIVTILTLLMGLRYCGSILVNRSDWFLWLRWRLYDIVVDLYVLFLLRLIYWILIDVSLTLSQN